MNFLYNFLITISNKPAREAFAPIKDLMKSSFSIKENVEIKIDRLIRHNSVDANCFIVQAKDNKIYFSSINCCKQYIKLVRNNSSNNNKGKNKH